MYFNLSHENQDNIITCCMAAVNYNVQQIIFAYSQAQLLQFENPHLQNFDKPFTIQYRCAAWWVFVLRNRLMLE